MKNRVLLISLAAVLVLSVSLVGCAGVTPPPTGPNETLNIARGSLAAETFFPWTGGAIEKNYLSGTIYESLTMRDRNGNVVWCLATGATMSADGKNWTVTIRQGIPFHDASGATSYWNGVTNVTYGNVTAADVKYTFERLASNGANTAPTYPASKSHIMGGLQADLGSNITAAIEVVGTDTVIFHLVQADIGFLKTYTGPDMMGVVCKSYVTAKGDTYAEANPVGTGPYGKFAQAPGAYITLKIIPNYENHWRMGTGKGTVTDPTKYYEYIKFWIVPDLGARVNGLLSGQYDYVEIDYSQYDTVMAASGRTVLATTSFVEATDLIRLGGLNQLDTAAHVPPDPVKRYNEANPWADNATVGNTTAGVLVRQAMNLAINKTAMIAAIYSGHGTPAPASMSIPEWKSPNNIPYGYDPATAESYLDSAGYPRSGNGTIDRFSITLIDDNRYAHHLNALAVHDYWEAVGINVTLQSMTWTNLRAAWSKGGNTTGNLAGTKDGINYAWMHRTPPTSGDPALAVNMAFDPGAVIGDYSDPTEDALRVAMLTATDTTTRTNNLIALGHYVHDYTTQVFLVSTYTLVGAKTTLAYPMNVFDYDENPELIHRT